MFGRNAEMQELEQRATDLRNACDRWKQATAEAEGKADYWAAEAARLRQEKTVAFNSENEGKQKELQELLTYWKGVAVSKEKEIESAHREIVQLRNELKQQRVLHADKQQQINRLHDQLAGKEKSE